MNLVLTVFEVSTFSVDGSWVNFDSMFLSFLGGYGSLCF